MSQYISNAFSLQMVPPNADVEVRQTSPEAVADAIHDGQDPVVSIIGHEDIAKLVGSLLGVELPVNRISIDLNPGDVLWVAQYSGPRLQPGTTELPANSKIAWRMLTYRLVAAE